MPKENQHSHDELLEDLNRVANQLGHPPTKSEVDEHGSHSNSTYRRRFPTFSTALAKAGLTPRTWNPLTTEEINEWHKTAKSQNPEEALTGLFFQFLPVPLEVFLDFESGWLTTLAEDTVLQVPAGYTPSSDSIEIRVPDTWTNPHTGTEEPTQLPQLLNWNLTEHGSTPLNHQSSLRKVLLRLGSATDFPQTRPTVDTDEYGTVSKITPTDLYHTHGIHLARNGASREWIARRMRLDRPEKAEVYFALLEHHDRY